MKDECAFYSLQLRPVEMSLGSGNSVSEMEVVVHPAGPGGVQKARFRQWEPIFERICSLLSSSPFHRKAMRRTLEAGLPAHMINRTTGSNHLFSAAELAELELHTADAFDSAA